MSLPLVSVLLPAYNHVEFIEQSVLSIINQDYYNIELIVVDDGSTDGTREKLIELKNKYAFQLISQDNRGLVYSLNLLKSLANGKYISLTASDDYYEKNKISTLVTLLESDDLLAFAYAKVCTVDLSGMIVECIDEAYESGYIFSDLLSGKFFINGLSLLIRKSVYDQFHYGQEYIDDLQMWLKITREYPVVFVDEYLAFYRVHNNHLSSNLLKMQESEERIISKYSDEPIYSYAYRKWNLRWLKNTSKCYKRHAIKYFVRSLHYKNLAELDFYKATINFFRPCLKR